MRRIINIGIAALLLVVIIAPVSFVRGDDPLDQFTYLPVIFKDFDPAWQFGDPLAVQLQPPPFSNPYLLVDTSGRPHLLYDTWSGENAFIYHTYLTDTGWTAPTPIAPTLGRSKLLNPPVAGSHNQIYLVWYNELNLGGPYRILYAAWDGTRWGGEYELLGDGKSPSINGLVREDRQGLPNVAYINSDGWFTSNLYFQKWTGNGFSPRQSVPRPAYSSLVWLDTTSGLRFYGDDSYNSTHYSYWQNGSFLVTNQVIAGKINYRASLLDSLNNLHLLRTASVPVPGGNVTGLFHQCLTSSLAWTSEQLLTGSDNVLNYTLSFDNLLQPVIAWSKENPQTLSVTFWNGCTLTQQKEISLPSLPSPAAWGDLITVSENTQATKFCLLSKQAYAPTNFWVTCTQ